MADHPPTHARFSGRAVVGVDLDGVCSDYVAGLRPYAASYLGVEETALPAPESYNLVKAGWPFQDTRDYLACHRLAVEDGLYARLPEIPGAAEGVRKLSAAGAHVRVVSHRLFIGGLHHRVVTDTATWLENVGIPYMSLCLTGLKDSVGAHVYVEDSGENIKQLQAMGMRVFCFDQPYNQNVVGAPRLLDWGNAADEILLELRRQGQLT